MKTSNFLRQASLLVGVLALPSLLYAGVNVIAKDVKKLAGSAVLIESNKYLSFTQKENGTATYSVVIPKAGVYKLKASVIARKSTENSMYFTLDSGAKKTWDFAISSSLLVNEFKDAISLSAGTHQLLLSGKEPYIKLASIEFVEAAAATPSPTPVMSPTPRDPASSALLVPDSSQFGNIDTSAAKIISASSVADAVTKMASAAPGSRVQLPSGNFSNINISVSGAGSSSSPVVLEGKADGSTILSGKVKIVVKGTGVVLRYLSFANADSQDYGGNSALVKFDGCSNCGLHRSSFVGGPAPVMSAGNDAKHFKSVLIAGTSQKVEVAYNSFRGKKNGGSVVLINRLTTRSNWNEGHRIYKNLFAERELAGDDANDFDVIRVGDSNTSQSPSPDVAEKLMSGSSVMVGNTIEFNLFENIGMSASLAASCDKSAGWNTSACKGEPEIISVKAPQTIVRFNTFLNASGGITLRHAFQCIIEGNYISGKNVSQGITNIVPNSYGVRVIGENQLVINNHIQDVSNTSNLLAAISILPGQPSAALNGYWPVYDSVIVMNFIKNVQGKVISLASDYGGRSKTILPEKIFLGHNVMSGSVAPIVNQASSTSYLTSFSFVQNMADGPKLSGALVNAVSSTSAIASSSIGRGLSAPSEAVYVGGSGVLVSSSSRQSAILAKLGDVGSATGVQRMKLLMQFLKLKNGSLYDNSLPLNSSDVGPQAK